MSGPSIQVLSLNHFSHLPSSSSNSTPSFIPKLPLKHFYKVRSARSNNNWKQSCCISCSHQSYFDQSLSPGPTPTSHASLSAAPSACSPQECWVMRDGKGHPGIRLRAMLGRKERCVMWGCVRLFTFTSEVFSFCFHPEEQWDELSALWTLQATL